MATRWLDLIAATSCAALLFAHGALAEDETGNDKNKFWFTTNIELVSDYVYRGVSNSDEKPALQGGADAGFGIYYAGIWASTVDEAFVATKSEIDIYAGVTPTIGAATFDFGVIYYIYPNQNFDVSEGLEVNYVEFKASVSTQIAKKITTSGTVYYSPEYSFETGESWTFEGAASYTLPEFGVVTPTVSGTVGHQKTEVAAFFDRDCITYWNAGLSLAIEKLTLDFRYWDSNIDDSLSERRFVFSTKVELEWPTE